MTVGPSNPHGTEVTNSASGEREQPPTKQTAPRKPARRRTYLPQTACALDARRVHSLHHLVGKWRSALTILPSMRASTLTHSNPTTAKERKEKCPLVMTSPHS